MILMPSTGIFFRQPFAYVELQHLQRYFNFPTKINEARKRENNAVVELANVLEGKLMGIDMKRLA